MKINVIGLGYLGAVTAACLASLGHKVVAIDRDEHKVNDYINNHGHIHEPGLKSLVQTNVQNGNLSFFSTIFNFINLRIAKNRRMNSVINIVCILACQKMFLK